MKQEPVAKVSEEFSDLVCIGDYCFHVEEPAQDVADAINNACRNQRPTKREISQAILEDAFGPPINDQRARIIEAVLDQIHGKQEINPKQ